MLQVRRHVEKVLRLNGGDVDDYDADDINIMSSKNKKYYEDNREDSFLIYSIYLNESHDDGSHPNNGIAHLAYIVPIDEDEYVNDFVGMVSSENEAFFEISYEDNVVESGYSEDGIWFARMWYKTPKP